MEPIIQIAGIHDWKEAALCVDLGVNYLGFPLRLPFHKEDLSEREAAQIIQKLPVHVKGVLITYLDKALGIKNFCDELGVKVVQLHGDISVEELQRLQEMAPELEIIKSLVVRKDNLDPLTQMVSVLCPWVDYFITDTFDPSTGATGATGKTHDWSVSATLVELSPKPVILAGGINPMNISEALEFVHPAGVDAHTGVEGADGRKDKQLVAKFVDRAKDYFQNRSGKGN